MGYSAVVHDLRSAFGKETLTLHATHGSEVLLKCGVLALLSHDSIMAHTCDISQLYGIQDLFEECLTIRCRSTALHGEG